MTPEHVGGDDRHPTLFHLAHFRLPLVGRHTGIVNLAHHGTDAPTVDQQAVTIPRDGLAKRGSPCGEDAQQQATGRQDYLSQTMHNAAINIKGEGD
jgi:hypothetical protein